MRVGRDPDAASHAVRVVEGVFWAVSP
jgi:hypothetical protein